jgi:hypothetical protein
MNQMPSPSQSKQSPEDGSKKGNKLGVKQSSTMCTTCVYRDDFDNDFSSNQLYVHRLQLTSEPSVQR